MSNHSFTWSRWVLSLKVYVWSSELSLTWCTSVVLFLAFVLFTTIKPMACLCKSREHLKSCWWFLPVSYSYSDETTSQHNTSRSIFPLCTHFCVAKGNQVFWCLYAQALLYETTLLLTLKWHLAGSTTRPSLNHLLAIEKVAFLAQERLFRHVCFS